jgi:resuscitation-promoting factor RpfB
LSQHRRRSPGKRRGTRRAGFLLPVTAMAVTAITGTTITGYLIVRSDQQGAGAAIAAAALPASSAMTVLERQRQQMIVMDAASHTLQRAGTPKLASRPSPSPAGGTGTGTGGVGTGVTLPPPDPGTAQRIAYNMMPSFGFDPSTQFSCLDSIWTRESGWNYQAENASGAYGIPQALPGSKMASAGADWQTNPATQIQWGLGYIKSTYGTPCNAWAFWQAHSYY